MYTLFWSFYEPGYEDHGTMPLEAATLEAAEREALALAKPWGALSKRKRGIFGLTILEGGKWLSNWSSLTRAWERYA